MDVVPPVNRLELVILRDGNPLVYGIFVHLDSVTDKVRKREKNKFWFLVGHKTAKRFKVLDDHHLNTHGRTPTVKKTLGKRFDCWGDAGLSAMAASCNMTLDQTQDWIKRQMLYKREMSFDIIQSLPWGIIPYPSFILFNTRGSVDTIRVGDFIHFLLLTFF